MMVSHAKLILVIYIIMAFLKIFLFSLIILPHFVPKVSSLKDQKEKKKIKKTTYKRILGYFFEIFT